MSLCGRLTHLMSLLEIENLQVDFRSGEGWVRAVDGVSLHIDSGETLCLVGESGCGKSVTALSIARLLPTPPARYAGGEIRFDGRDVLRMRPADLLQLRGRSIGYVFQDPGTSLNPVIRVGAQIKESIAQKDPALATDAEVVRRLAGVGSPAPELRARSYPHQLSGGMQQRIMIAMALAAEPRLLIADEPTTALDVTIQAQILELLMELKQRHHMAMLLITHNLGIARSVADRVSVMYAGQLVESAPASPLVGSPRHPYTRALIRSVPELGHTGARLEGISGTVPGLGRWPGGCRFAPRCVEARPDCSSRVPDWLESTPDHGVRCPYTSS